MLNLAARLIRKNEAIRRHALRRCVNKIIEYHPDDSLRDVRSAERWARGLRLLLPYGDQRSPQYWDYEGILFELSYFTNPNRRDRICFREARTRTLIQRLPEFPGTVIEAGCGSGRSLFYLDRFLAPLSLQGFDQSANLVRWARQIASRGDSDRFRFWVGDVTDGAVVEQADLSQRPVVILVNDVFSYLAPDQCNAGLRNLIAFGAEYLILHQSLGNRELADLDSYERPRGKWAHNLERKLRAMGADYEVVDRDFELRRAADGRITNRLSVTLALARSRG